ncbi:hypothetical protein LOTGIDRAFT_151943 [Lottia gigantea]|uniref:CCHC-type domain-containing protein n=1 Tax=Lottia gigantea TaxID=225164 RepID=V4BGV3_LOTGI|nr:hypothetical protein LOTGIDRAFT_151943 [Lottia gigantea]ESP05142.1 hypothetical protein LOTGIDRAFT_151943 [Lottia gigantea]
MSERVYSKELVVDIVVGELRNIKLNAFIDEIENLIGVGNVYAVTKCRPNIIQVAVNSKENAEKLCGGIRVSDVEYVIKMPYSPYTIVSFLDIPSYIEDAILINKLKMFKIDIEGSVVRHYFDAYERIENGIRHVKCIFPPEVKSLPWAVNLETVHGMKSFRVLHNNQKNVCHKCYSDDHLIAKCPKIRCRKCHDFGHMGNKCNVKFCDVCKKLDIDCICNNYFEDDIDSEVNELSGQLSDNSDVATKENMVNVTSSDVSKSSVSEQVSKKVKLSITPISEPMQQVNDLTTHANERECANPSESTRVYDTESTNDIPDDFSIIKADEIPLNTECEVNTNTPPPSLKPRPRR